MSRGHILTTSKGDNDRPIGKSLARVSLAQEGVEVRNQPLHAEANAIAQPSGDQCQESGRRSRSPGRDEQKSGRPATRGKQQEAGENKPRTRGANQAVVLRPSHYLSIHPRLEPSTPQPTPSQLARIRAQRCHYESSQQGERLENQQQRRMLTSPHPLSRAPTLYVDGCASRWSSSSCA